MLSVICFVPFALRYDLSTCFMVVLNTCSMTVFLFCMFCFLFCVFRIFVLFCVLFLPVYTVVSFLFVH
jgi:hypothetical protein